MRRRRNKVISTIINILLTFFASIFIISLAVTITIHFRPLYYMDIKLLNIPKQSGYSASIIRENYDALINYSSFFYKGELQFPSLEMSEFGKIHFEECKNIFNYIYILTFISFIFTLILGIIKCIQKQYRCLKYISITSTLLPIIVGTGIAINFDKAFTLFHEIFFNNDYWVFDPLTDPVINILPETFFMHCAILIILLILTINIILFLIYKRLKRNHDDQYIR